MSSAVYCRDCHYWEELVDDRQRERVGECRLFPPVYTVGDADKYRVWKFPLTPSGRCCGQFKERVVDSEI